MEHHLSFSCDYMEGAHPRILQRLIETNLVQTPGYGLDSYCTSAKEKSALPARHQMLTSSF